MGFFSRALARFRSAVEKGVEALKLAPMYGMGLFFSGTKASMAKLMAEAVGWVFSCISRISETIISERMRLYRKTGDGPEDWTEITEHPFLDLIQRPNKWMPGSELIQTWSQHEDLTGNAYWVLEGVQDEFDEPTAIYPLNPAYMTVVVGSVPGEPDQVIRYDYQAGAIKRAFQPFEILHFRRVNPNDPFRGLGPTEGSMDAVDTDNWMREWNRRFFQNSAIPGVVLETEENSVEMLRLLRESFEDRHAGVERAHKTVALPKGVKLAQMGYGQKDMDFVESRSKNRDEILAAFGVPPVVLGMGMGESVNRATAEVQEYVYAKYTIKPKLMRFECYINEFFLMRYGDDLAIAFDDCVPKNVAQNITLHTAALGGAAYMTINEVRASEGLEPIEGGDVVPAPKVPAVPGQMMLTAKARIAPDVRLRLASFAKIRKQAIKTVATVSDAITKVVTDAVLASRKKSVADLATIDWAENWKAFADRTIKGEGKMKTTMEEYAEGMAKRAETALKKAFKSKKKAADGAKLLDRKKEVQLIIDVMDPLYIEILKNEGISAAKLVDAAFDENEESMRKALTKSVNLMASKYTDATIDALETAIAEGLEKGEGMDALAERISQVGEWSKTTRAEAVARTEAFRTANFATKEAWKQSGVVKTIKWYTAEDERVCEFCGVMDGKVVSVEADFLEKGETLTGSDGGTFDADYAAVEGGSLHVNCRCSIAPEKIEI